MVQTPPQFGGIHFILSEHLNRPGLILPGDRVVSSESEGKPKETEEQTGTGQAPISKTESALWSANRIMVYIAAVSLFGMMMTTVVDVVGRYVFSHPLLGAYELVGFLLAIAGPWAMGYSQLKKGMIRVDFLLRRFSRRSQAIITSLAHLIGFAGFVLLTWQLAVLAKYYLALKHGSATDTLHIPIFPFVIAVALGCAMLAIVLLYDLARSLSEVNRK
jgi:TRAP-type C4-dicarboxylate transport system permease small subunit